MPRCAAFGSHRIRRRNSWVFAYQCNSGIFSGCRFGYGRRPHVRLEYSTRVVAANFRCCLRCCRCHDVHARYRVRNQVFNGKSDGERAAGNAYYHPSIEELLQSALKPLPADFDSEPSLYWFAHLIMTQDPQHQVLKVVLHAPTSSALQRARNNAMNLRRDAPEADIRIVVNAEAVAAALDQAHPEADPFTWVCPNTLARLNKESRAPLRVLDRAAVLELVRLQQDGWIYIRS